MLLEFKIYDRGDIKILEKFSEFNIKINILENLVIKIKIQNKILEGFNGWTHQ